jgi:hypothetical protein
MDFSDTYNRIANQKPPSRRGLTTGLAAPFPACSPAAVQSHQRALPMLRAWIEHIRADVKAGLKIEDHYRKAAAKHHFVLVDEETAAETRKRLASATEPFAPALPMSEGR